MNPSIAASIEAVKRYSFMAFRAGKLLGLLITVALLLATVSGTSKLYAGSWAVEVRSGDAAADALAARHGLVNLGQVSSTLAGRRPSRRYYIPMHSPN